jgi:hypothetical protein
VDKNGNAVFCPFVLSVFTFYDCPAIYVSNDREQNYLTVVQPNTGKRTTAPAVNSNQTSKIECTVLLPKKKWFTGKESV